MVLKFILEFLHHFPWYQHIMRKGRSIYSTNNNDNLYNTHKKTSYNKKYADNLKFISMVESEKNINS